MVSVCVPMFADLFLSTLPARGATEHSMTLTLRGGISIHAPREGSDRRPILTASYGTVFLSTLPARGATTSAMTAKRTKQDFYPRSPRGERRRDRQRQTGNVGDFYPRSPRGERHPQAAGIHGADPISIHAPREGSDMPRPYRSDGIANFYPRSPRGERRSLPRYLITVPEFLSTLPARGATISSDCLTQNIVFLSTLPARGATLPLPIPRRTVPISIHAPREGSDEYIKKAEWLDL